MPAGNTYEAIATQTLGSAAASVTFSSIPGTYTDLVLVINTGTSSGEQDCIMRFNSDSGSNYSSTYIIGNGSSASSGRNTNATAGSAGYPLRPSLISTLITQIQNYSNTTTNKTWITRSGAADASAFAMVSLWRNTGAINNIYLAPSNGVNFLASSTFSLYGIKAA
jgi:hypothetical protein